jgi:hypothetical protein
MSEKKLYARLPETTDSRRTDLLAKWVAKAKSELPVAQDEMDAWLSKLDACLKLPTAKTTA